MKKKKRKKEKILNFTHLPWVSWWCQNRRWVVAILSSYCTTTLAHCSSCTKNPLRSDQSHRRNNDRSPPIRLSADRSVDQRHYPRPRIRQKRQQALRPEHRHRIHRHPHFHRCCSHCHHSLRRFHCLHRHRRRRRRYHPPPKTEPDCPPETEPDCPPVLIVVRIGTRDTTSHCAPERPPCSDDGPTAITKRRYRRRLLRAEPPFDEQTLQPCALRGSPPVGEYFSKLFRKSNYVSFILDGRIVHVVFLFVKIQILFHFGFTLLVNTSLACVII